MKTITPQQHAELIALVEMAWAKEREVEAIRDKMLDITDERTHTNERDLYGHTGDLVWSPMTKKDAAANVKHALRCLKIKVSK